MYLQVNRVSFDAGISKRNPITFQLSSTPFEGRTWAGQVDMWSKLTGIQDMGRTQILLWGSVHVPTPTMLEKHGVARGGVLLCRFPLEAVPPAVHLLVDMVYVGDSGFLSLTASKPPGQGAWYGKVDILSARNGTPRSLRFTPGKLANASSFDVFSHKDLPDASSAKGPRGSYAGELGSTGDGRAFIKRRGTSIAVLFPAPQPHSPVHQSKSRGLSDFAIGPLAFQALMNPVGTPPDCVSFAYLESFGTLVINMYSPVMLPSSLRLTSCLPCSCTTAPFRSVLDRTFLQHSKQGKFGPSRKNAQREVMALTSYVLNPQGQELDKVKVRASLSASILPCLTSAGFEPLIKIFFEQALGSPDGARLSAVGYLHTARLLDLLAPQFAVVAPIPHDSTPLIRQAVARAKALVAPTGRAPPPRPTVAEDARLEALVPELFELMKSDLLASNVCAQRATPVFNALCTFILALCDDVEGFSALSVDPPPFERIEGTNNPATRGVAFYLTEHMEQGRYVRKYGPPGQKPKKDEEACKKTFAAARAQTGGVFR